MKIRYGELCEDAEGVLRSLLETCGLPFTEEFRATIPTGLRCANYKWRENLSEETVDRIRSEDPEFYGRFEFPD